MTFFEDGMPWDDDLACKEVDNHIEKYVKDRYPGMLQLHEIPFTLWEVKFGVEPIPTPDARSWFSEETKHFSSFYFNKEEDLWLGSKCFSKHVSGFTHKYNDRFDVNKAHIKLPSINEEKYLQMAKNTKERNLNVHIIIACGDIRNNGHAFVYKPMKIDTVCKDGINLSVADF